MAQLGPLPSVPGTIKIRLIYTWANRPAYNIFHVGHSSSGLFQSDLNTLCTSIRGYWLTRLAPIISSDVTLSSVDATDISSRTGLTGVNATAAIATGSNISGCPSSIALCVSQKTAYRFRGGHSRLYLPGMISGNIQGLNTFTTGYLNTVNTNVAGWLTDLKSIQIGAQPIVPVMVSYYSHDANKQPIYRPEGPQKYPITSMVAHSRVDTQRRRLGREGT